MGALAAAQSRNVQGADRLPCQLVRLPLYRFDHVVRAAGAHHGPTGMDRAGGPEHQHVAAGARRKPLLDRAQRRGQPGLVVGAHADGEAGPQRPQQDVLARPQRSQASSTVEQHRTDREADTGGRAAGEQVSFGSDLGRQRFTQADEVRPERTEAVGHDPTLAATGHPVPSWRVDLSERRIAARWYAAEFRQRTWARWSLRKVSKVGTKAIVLGRPTVDATDLEVGDSFKVWSGHRKTLISGWGRIRIGDRVFINCGTVIIAVKEIVIGDDVAFANEVYVMDSNSHGVEGRAHVEAPVHIGAGTWVGNRATILPGVRIGKRVVVAAGAVVTRDVPDDSLVAGNPARVVRALDYPPGCRRAWHDEWGCPCPKLVAEPPEEPEIETA